MTKFIPVCKCSWSRHVRTLLDICVFPTIFLAFSALSWLPELLFWANSLLVFALIVKCWILGNDLTLVVADYAVIGIALAYGARLAVRYDDLALVRIAGLYSGIMLYWLVRTSNHSRRFVRWTASALSILFAMLSAMWISRCWSWMKMVQSAGFADVTALKARVVSILGGPINEWASVLILAFVLELVVLRPSSTRFHARNLLLFLLMLATLAGLFLTFSRSAYIALLIVAVGFTIYMCVCRKQMQWRLWRVVIISVVLLSSAISVDVLSGGAVRRTASLWGTEQQRRSSSGRIQVWSSALGMASGHWLLGTGPGTFAMRFVRLAGLGEGGSFVSRPLNTALSLLTEEGVVGLTLYFLLVVSAIVGGWRHLQSTHDARGYPVMVLVLGVIAFCIRELAFSSLVENSLVGCLFFFTTAMLVTKAQPVRSSASRRLRLPSLAMTVISVLGSVIFFLGEYRRCVDTRAQSAAECINTAEFDRCSDLAEEAVQGRVAPHHLSLRALFRALQSMPGFDIKSQFQVVQAPAARQELKKALADYDRAIEMNPNDDLFWHNRAWIRIALGERPAAVLPDFHRAVEIDGGTPAYRVSLGLVLEDVGAADQAIVQYAAALAATPDLSGSPFAHALREQRPELWKTVLVTAAGMLRTRDPEGRDVAVQARLGPLYFEQGRREQADRVLEVVVSAVPQFPRAWKNLGMAQLAANQIDKAAESLQKSAFLDPWDPTTWELLATIFQKKGKGSEAEEFSRKAAIAAQALHSPHSARVARVYKTAAIVNDDILPAGLLAYCASSIPRYLAKE